MDPVMYKTFQIINFTHLHNLIKKILLAGKKYLIISPSLVYIIFHIAPYSSFFSQIAHYCSGNLFNMVNNC